jgi:16S rRNA processing protein RimM
MTDDRLVVGLVRGVHGLRGAVRVEILTDVGDRFAPGSVVYPEGSDRRLTVVTAHRDGPGFLVRFDEVPDRDAADQLRDTYLEAEPGDLAVDTFYWHDIIGCSVEGDLGTPLGTVKDVFRVGESEVYVVEGESGELQIPSVRSVVKLLAPAERRIVVDEAALGLTEEDQ